MPYTDAELMNLLVGLRKEAFTKLAAPLREAVLGPYAAQTRGIKTASEFALTDKTLVLHTVAP